MSERRRTDLNSCTVQIIGGDIDRKPCVLLSVRGYAMLHLSAADAVSLAGALRDAASGVDVEPARIGWRAGWSDGQRATTESA